MWGFDRKQLAIGLILLCAVMFGVGYQVAQAREKGVVHREPGLSDYVSAGTGQGGAAPGTGVSAPASMGPVQPGQPSMEKKSPKTVTIYVSGAVKKPGVYVLEEGARAVDGINKAEPAKDAELTYINLAELVSDGQQIIVPNKVEADSQGISGLGRRESSNAASGPADSRASGGANRTKGKININVAGVGELQGLPGVGPATAEKIIRYRQEKGRFKTTSDLLSIPGIGEKKLAKMLDRISL